MTDLTPERLAEIKERIRFTFATAIGLMSAGSLRIADAYIEDVPDLIAALEAAQAENAKLREALEPLYLAARGLSFGEDWNNGTQAKLHGYRQKLIAAIPSAHAALEAKP